ncbi:inosine-uridine preferring nucleoside hydrolase-like protein [Lasius niger]|uniref:Inosine-uridine preferring nucleoside hydrolase-like protein n=1 Tax=Lasius niger TaxID=67767 RepID=A0A0J7N9R6_LASNI|nr:inosine-uridine preferring nucleoside hydrolase-like protein [Lasius niger]
MSNYPPIKVVDILLILAECHRNYRRAAHVYAQRFSDRRYPANWQIRKIKRRSRRNPTNQEYHQKQRNRLQNNNDLKVLAVLGMAHINPHISTRQAEPQLGFPRATIHQILQSVRYRPYHITLVQELNKGDHRMRAQFCR